VTIHYVFIVMSEVLILSGSDRLIKTFNSMPEIGCLVCNIVVSDLSEKLMIYSYHYLYIVHVCECLSGSIRQAKKIKSSYFI
jgi:hypothetical protein